MLNGTQMTQIERMTTDFNILSVVIRLICVICVPSCICFKILTNNTDP